MRTALAFVLLALSGGAARVEGVAQSNEQVLAAYQKAAEHHARGAYAEALRLCAELVKQRPDKEGVLRVRVGAGNEDKEFEPRRVAGDASMQLAKNAADLEARLRLVDDAIRWYQASSDLKLAKSAKLLEAARAERAKVVADLEGAKGAELLRRRVEAVRKDVTEKMIAREFEAAFASLEKARPQFAGSETAWEALRTDLQAEFQRWHDGLLAELRRDLEAFRPARVLAEPGPTAERLARFRIPPERVAAARLNPLVGWAGRLGSLLERAPLHAGEAEALAVEAARLGVLPWRAAAGLVLEPLAAGVKDPGAGASLEARWEAVSKAQGAFAAAAERFGNYVENASRQVPEAAREDLRRWRAEDLADLERRVAQAVKALPDRDAPRAVESCLAKLEAPAILEGARPDGYAAVEAELRELASRARLTGALQARLTAGVAIARAYAAFLEGVPREGVVERCRPAAREALAADPAAFDSWKPKVSPRVAWVLDQLKP
jgi:hypothetical protein